MTTAVEMVRPPDAAINKMKMNVWHDKAMELNKRALDLLENTDDGKTSDERDAEYEVITKDLEAAQAAADRLWAEREREQRLTEQMERYMAPPTQAPIYDDRRPPPDMDSFRFNEKTEVETLRALCRGKEISGSQRAQAEVHQELIKNFITTHPTVGLPPTARKALTTLVDAEGGFIVDSMMASEILIRLADVQFIRMAADVKQMSVGQITEPRLQDHLTASWEGEAPPQDFFESWTGDTNPLDLLTYQPYNLTAFIRTSRDLYEDSSLLMDMIMSSAMLQFTEGEQRGFTIGNGVKQPLGLFTDSRLPGIMTASSGSLTFDDIHNLELGIKQQYRSRVLNPAFILNRGIIRTLRKIKDNEGQYLWSPGLAAGQPSTLLGYPVYESEESPDEVTAGNKIAVFGAMKYMKIYDRSDMGIMTQQLVERFALRNEIGFIFRKRTTGMVNLPEAFCTLTVS